jgi:two-component system, LytTR family, response regulator
MIRVILVDDDYTQLNMLRQGLERYDADIEVIGTFTNQLEAAAKIIHLKPHALFLDIEMPGMSGFELAEMVEDACKHVIYVTNYMKHGSETYLHKAVFLIYKLEMEKYLPPAVARLNQ